MRGFLVVAAALGACATRPQPDTITPKLEVILQRLDRLDAAQKVQDERLEALADGVAEVKALSEERLARIELSLADLDDELRRVGTSVAARISTPPPPSTGTAIRPGRPDPAKVYSVPIGGDPARGDKKALVTIVQFGEFACPFCFRVRATLKDIEARYGKDVRVVFKHFVVHPQIATVPAHASCAAHRQGKFWEMEAAIFDSAWEWTDGTPRLKDAALLGRENLLQLAARLGLDLDQFERDLDGAACAQDVADDMAVARKLGVSGTPAFFVNGRYLSGARPIEMFTAVIDEELKKAQEAVKSRKIKPETYYQKAVVEGGLAQVD